jgi:gamma-glutamylaminecyclotransferase
MLLFVYGTLMRGEPAHALLGDSIYLGEARTVPGFTLVDLGPYPALLRLGQGTAWGELYELPTVLLGTLDDYEDCPALYRREEIVLEDERRATTYLGPNSWHREFQSIPSGNWRHRR